MTLKTTKDQMLGVFNGKRYRFIAIPDTTCEGCAFGGGFSCLIPSSDRACHPLFRRADNLNGRWKEVK